MWKLQFITNALIPLAYGFSVVNLFGKGGLVEVMDGVFLSNIFMNFLVQILFDVPWFMKLINRWRVRRFIKSGKGTVWTQHEANLVYENNKWEISYKYSYMIKTLSLGLFYY